jgi:hypothetical protein
MTETIEQAAREYWKRGQFGLEKPADTERAFYRGVMWQRSQPNPHRITVDHLMEIQTLYDRNKISYSRMVEILNEIAEGKHKERIEI